MENQSDEKRFSKIFWFVCGFSLLILLFMFCLIFLHVPKENSHNADMTLSFLFGTLTGVLGVIIITNPNQKKQTDSPVPGTQQNSIQVTRTTTDTTPENNSNVPNT